MLPITHLDLSQIRFLIIDDNAFIRRLTREILHSFGARTVFEAASAQDALEEISVRPPDIILCDWMMHPLDGLAFLKNLRAGPWSHIPVIMVTGHASGDHVAAAMGSGADSYIVKPFRVTTLLDHIVKVIAASEARQKDTFHV